LFVYVKEAERPMWMMNMTFSIDIIWLNQDREIVHMVEGAPPCRRAQCDGIHPEVKARYVLEVPAGSVFEKNLVAGDRMEFPLRLSNDTHAAEPIRDSGPRT
jgi:uncharacterized protein